MYVCLVWNTKLLLLGTMAHGHELYMYIVMLKAYWQCTLKWDFEKSRLLNMNIAILLIAYMYVHTCNWRKSFELATMDHGVAISETWAKGLLPITDFFSSSTLFLLHLCCTCDKYNMYSKECFVVNQN